MADNQNKNDPTVDGPTVYGPNTGQYIAPPTAYQPDEPTTGDPDKSGTGGDVDGPTPPQPSANEPPAGEEPTIAQPTSYQPAASPTGDDETTASLIARPSTHQPAADPDDDEPIVTVGSDAQTSHQPTGNQDEPTIMVGGGDPTMGESTAAPLSHRPTNASPPPTNQDEPTVAVGAGQQAGAAASHPAEPGGDGDEVTVAVGGDDPTTTGPTVGGWPFDQFEPPPSEELVWRAEPSRPEPPVVTRSPAYYVSLGAAIVLVVGLVAVAVVVTLMRPQREVAGAATAFDIPQITPSNVPPPTTGAPAPPPSGPFAELATHPLSSLDTRMADTTCALSRFDPADDRQAAFYAAAKVCADGAWGPLLSAAGVDGTVTVVTLTGPAQTASCGELAPTSPATECDGTVYLTPAYLRDTEQNGRYPGRYLGVFLREYVRALQFTTGIDELVAALDTGSSEDIDKRLAQQATCLAGAMSGSMAGRGAVDSNITGEIRDRLSTKDAPPDAKAWLDKGFQQRTPAACNTWVS